METLAPLKPGRHLKVIDKKGLTQSYIIIGSRSKARRYEKDLALRLISMALGTGLSSRLYMELREKSSLVYATHARRRAWKEAGIFTIESLTANKNTPKALQKMLSVLSKVYKKGITSRELKRAKNQVRNGFASLVETSENMADAIITLQSVGISNPYQELKTYLDKLDKISRSEIKKTFKEVIHLKNLQILLLADKDQIDLQKIKKMKKWTSFDVVPFKEVSF